MDFGLARFNARTRPRRLELPQITSPDSPTLALLVADLGGSNPAHYSWLLKHAAPDPATVPAEGTPERRDYNRQRNAVFIGEVAIVGWENVCCDGQPAPCTPEHAITFMRQLAEHRPDVFDAVTLFVFNPEQPAAPTVPPTDPDDLGKDSPRG